MITQVTFGQSERLIGIKRKKAGKGAMAIKILDIADNLKFIPLLKDQQIFVEMGWKINFTLSQLKPYLGETAIFHELQQKLKRFFYKNSVYFRHCFEAPFLL